MEQIVFLDRDTIAPQITVRRPDFDHTWKEYAATNASEVVDRLREATIVISNKVPLDRTALEKLPKLRMIAMAATGYDIVDTDYCRDKGIVLSNIRGYAVNSVPEHTFSLILALRRNLLAYHEDVKNGVWQKSEQFCFFAHPIQDLAGSNLIIVGSGSIGSRVAALGKAFGMKVKFAARKGQKEFGAEHLAFEEALAVADILTLHCPLTPANKGMISMPEFKAMKRRPLLINTARGNLVDEMDLGAALRDDLISGAGFDVAANEPLENSSPLIDLLDLPNFILTPHIAWASNEALQTLADQIIDNIENFVKGSPSNVVV